MHVLVQMKVPVEIAMRVRDRLEKLLAAHRKDIAAADRRSASSDEREILASRGARLTFNNMLRVMLEDQLEAFEDLSNEEIAERLMKSGVARGRPRAVASR